jgi:hypothetical protein
MTTALDNFDFASRGYIAKLNNAIETGVFEPADLIASSAAMQDALEGIRGFNAADRAFVESAGRYIGALTDSIKSRSSPVAVDDLASAYGTARRRVIVEPVHDAKPLGVYGMRA